MGNHKAHKKGVRWWTPSDKSIFARFCNDTSIHGLQYLGADGVHIGERVLWGFVFIVSALTSLWLIRADFMDYFDSPIVFSFRSSQMFIEDIPFPSITICNMNRVLRSEAEKYMRIANASNETRGDISQARRDVYYLNHVCSVSNKPFHEMFNYSVMGSTVDPSLLDKVRMKKEDEDVEHVSNFLLKASQNCKQMIKLCAWGGEVFDCEKYFRPVETNFGRCCTFNMVPRSMLYKHINDERDTEERLEEWDWKGGSDNFDNIFGESTTDRLRPRHQQRAGKPSGLMFLADPAINEYFCTSSDSLGFRVRRVNIKLSVHDSYDIPHVTDFGIAIRPDYEHFVSVTPDVIIANRDIKSYSLETRECYLENEKSLKYFNYYSSSNCLDECVAEETFKQCKCVRYYMPKSVFKSRKKDMCNECLPKCSEVSYSASSTMAPLQGLDGWLHENKTAMEWENKNVSIVHVYFGGDSVYPKERKQLYGITALIANTGGILGLCMGFSLLSLFEVLYYFTIRHWYKNKQEKRVLNVTENKGKNGCSQTAAYTNKTKPFDNGKCNSQISSSNAKSNGHNIDHDCYHGVVNEQFDFGADGKEDSKL